MADQRPMAASVVSPPVDVFTEEAGPCRATVYDAVAGKVTQSGMHKSRVAEQKRATVRLRPDEVLFKQQNAPPRYEEADYYFANRNLVCSQDLPSGDLLSALHGYVSNLHDHSGSEDEGPGFWRSMDETALLALGVLLEEAVKETLGKTGDLALVEAVSSEEDEAGAGEDGGAGD